VILGLSIPAFTLLHMVLSLIGIVAGAIVVVGMLRARRLEGWTLLFLVTTVLTSMTGYLFPASVVTPVQVVGGISLVFLLAAVCGFYVYRLRGGWRWIYVAAALVALYLNVFVGVAQALQKLPVLQRLRFHPGRSGPGAMRLSPRDSGNVMAVNRR
jgi:hypothetical protein